MVVSGDSDMEQWKKRSENQMSIFRDLHFYI